MKIIDVSDKFIYNEEHINGSVNIPYDRLINNYRYYLNKNDTYYIYCQYGKTSLQVCNYLSKLGYKVKNILGGYESYLLEK